MTYFALGVVMLLGVMVSTTWAQRGGRIHYSTLFNPDTVVTVSGEVVRVEHTPAGSGADLCVQALLRTSQGNITAVLAPKGYMADKGLTIAPKDRVTVKGSKVTIMNRPYIVATEVSGDRSMKLRAADGRPLWAAGDDWHVR